MTKSASGASVTTTCFHGTFCESSMMRGSSAPAIASRTNAPPSARRSPSRSRARGFPGEFERSIEALPFLFLAQLLIPSRVETTDHGIGVHRADALDQGLADLLTGVVGIDWLNQCLLDRVGTSASPQMRRHTHARSGRRRRSRCRSPGPGRTRAGDGRSRRWTGHR